MRQEPTHPHRLGEITVIPETINLVKKKNREEIQIGMIDRGIQQKQRRKAIENRAPKTIIFEIFIGKSLFCFLSKIVFFCETALFQQINFFFEHENSIKSYFVYIHFLVSNVFRETSVEVINLL